MLNEPPTDRAAAPVQRLQRPGSPPMAAAEPTTPRPSTGMAFVIDAWLNLPRQQQDLAEREARWAYDRMRRQVAAGVLDPEA